MNAIVTLAEFYGVTSDYLLGITGNCECHPCPVDELGLDDDTIDLLKERNLNVRLICEMIKDPHFPDFLSDLEIYVDNLASAQIRNMNKYIEHNRAMIKNKYALSDSDHYMRSLKAVLIDEDNYFDNLLGNDISAIAKNLRELHKKDSNTGSDDTVFDEFMDTNGLYQVALSDADDDTILKAFLRAKLPDRLVEDFFAFFDVVKSPIAIRSSSLLEDSHYQPFAGIYSTYMIPYLEDKYEMLRMLSDAIKGVYASVYYRDSKAYMQATSNVIDQEKMAVILQEVVGTQYGDRFYPSISGVARSLNYYPIGDETAEEGTVSLALGLGKYIVDGGLTLRICPYHPNQVLQTSEMEIALRETQTRFYALDLKNTGHNFSLDDGFNLLKLPVKEADNDGALNFIASTYDPYDMVIRDGIYPGGRKLITFANVLQHDVFPLPRILQLAQEYGQSEMRRPVEIEFAVTLNAQKKTGVFYLLQIRPMVDIKAVLDEDLNLIKDENVLLRSNNSLGHGIMEDIHDIIYVKTEGYTASNNPTIAYEIEKMNRKFLDEGKHYILVGPGRWGSSDSWLGIPVKWPHISAARIIVEAGLTNYRVDPSQGTHFFQNLTSFGVGYFTINSYMNDGVYNQDILNAQPAVEESQFIRHVRFDNPLIVKMDGKKKQGVVMLPE